ncbi:MAG TPA: ribosome assembly RNA-binding protein YhbY [Candidatus Avanaerovorax faecigallinarum]|nr:ribosome assembly RNA-binding protein YhbY [Candidatus Avanaerovorax faecigallinarum]
MITGKQRSYLKGLANQLDPLVFIGKADLTDTVIKEIDNVLNARELVKVKIQESSLLDPKETANKLADLLGAEFVQAIGRKFVLYRESKDNKKIYLPK